MELQLTTRGFPDDPALDTSVSRALLERVARNELPETLRLWRPGRSVAFGKRDALGAGFAAAVEAAREQGFGAALRLAGGRAAAFHEETVAIAHAVPDTDSRIRVQERFEVTAQIVAGALRGLGADARIGEVPGEYCPGGYSVNTRGALKLAGIGQRVIAGAAHVGGVVVAARADLVQRALVPVYEELGLAFDPATAGSLADEVGRGGFEQVAAALQDEYAARYELVEAELDAETLTLARSYAAAHRPPDRAGVARPASG
jgi:octanoyl-[GcvH]:protein N-octanoyltransferase